jgi:hypothetical protein
VVAVSGRGVGSSEVIEVAGVSEADGGGPLQARGRKANTSAKAIPIPSNRSESLFMSLSL